MSLKNKFTDFVKHDLQIPLVGIAAADDIPSDIKEYQVRGLKEQRLAAEGKFQELSDMLSEDLRLLHAPADTMEAFRALTHAENMDLELRAGIADRIVRWIHLENKRRQERT